MEDRTFPSGVHYIAMLLEFRGKPRSRDGVIGINELKELGTSLAVLYRVGSCEDGTKCRGGGHILEKLAARSHNLGAAAFLLTSADYYDEALNLVRSLGEITNLLAYFCKHPEMYPVWATSSEADRKKTFPPGAIRNAIENLEDLPIPMSTAKYH